MTNSFSNRFGVVRKCVTSTFAILALSLSASAQQVEVSKAELFGGYSYLYPNATLSGTLPGGVLPLTSCLCAIPAGGGVSGTYNLNRWLGLTADFSGHRSSSSSIPAEQIGRSSFYNESFGPRFTYRTHHFAPFAEALFGAHRLAPQLFAPDTRFGIIAGGGLDFPLGPHFAIRAVQADFVYSNHHFGQLATVPGTNLRGLRLQSGVVFMFGGHAHHANALPVAAAPMAVAEVAAPVAAPAIPAPSVMCSANPSNMLAGESSNITAAGTSVRPLSYSFQSNAGAISSSGSTAMLSTVGAAPGLVLVTCHVIDEMGQTAFATTSVTLNAAPLKAVTAIKSLGPISFARDRRRPVRVDNEAKAQLDSVALSLQREPDARLLLSGHSDRGENSGIAIARATNAKAYLTSEKGIDPARVMINKTSAPAERTVAITLIPIGAALE